MNKILCTCAILLSSLTGLAQDTITEELKTLSSKNEHDKIIEQYARKSEDYTAKSLYYIGIAYYIKEDDTNCLKYMDRSIDKDAGDPLPYYVKAATLNYMGKYSEAVKAFESAIALKADDAKFYGGLGDSYYHLEKYDAALVNYKKATTLPNCSDRAYSMIAQTYSELKENDKALDAFYLAKTKISKESSSYINALFNIGLLESLKGNYDSAELAFTELLQLKPDDYHSYAKLIQIYYARKEYNKAKPYKDKIYDAYKNGQLKGNLKDMFCFDQFKWNGYLVQVFERYENEDKGDIYNKHIFYVVDNKDKIVLRVQTEFSPISLELGGPKYLLCATKGTTHYNPVIGFNDDFNYDNLKAEAIKLFEEYVKE